MSFEARKECEIIQVFHLKIACFEVYCLDSDRLNDRFKFLQSRVRTSVGENESIDTEAAVVDKVAVISAVGVNRLIAFGVDAFIE